MVVVLKAVRLSDGLAVYDLEHRRCVAALYMFYKMNCNPKHASEAALTRVHVSSWLTRLAVSVHSRYLVAPRCHIVQFGRSFVPACVQLWNSLAGSRLAGDGVAAFKSRISRALLFD